MHTDATLQLLDTETVELGTEFRSFINAVCSEIQTKELAIEVAARQRREQRKLLKELKVAKDGDAMDAPKTASLGGDVGPPVPNDTSNMPNEGSNEGGKPPQKPTTGIVKPLTAKLVALNIRTPKFHFLGDYSGMIRTFGTSDSYSTQSVSADLQSSYARLTVM
jgi:hypothetical protein